MRAALSLARRARGATAPNPAVGAMIVHRGQRIAAGSTRPFPGAHAEAVALVRAGQSARGATLYVTLEPCAHHGNNPPCVDALIAAKIARVVVGQRDPNPNTNGKGLAKLRRAGIRVDLGVEEAACRELHEGFVSRVERGRPFTTLKLAASLDGRIATRTGESRWITGPKARAYVHRIRASCDAVAVGSGTLLADDPQLCARARNKIVHVPTRIVVDSKLKTPPGARAIDPEAPERTWLLTSKSAPAARRRRLERAGVRLLEVRQRAGQLDLRAAWKRLGALGVNDLLVEGGGGLAAALLRAGLVDRLLWFSAPLLIGSDGRPVLQELGVGRLGAALRPRDMQVRRLGADFLFVAEW